MFGKTGRNFVVEAPISKLKKEIQDLNMSSGFLKRSGFLRKFATILKLDISRLDWEIVKEELHEAWELKVTFNVLAFSTDNALVEFSSEEDRNACLDAK